MCVPYVCSADFGLIQQSSELSSIREYLPADSAAAAAGSAAADGSRQQKPSQSATEGLAAVAASAPSSAVLAANSVELSVLRAELAASDAEVDHLLSHLAILQHQVSAAAAGVSAGRVAGSLVAGSAAEVLVSELAFLRDVSSAVDSS